MALFIFTKNILDGKSIPIYNNGKMKRDFTYINDIIAGTSSAINYKYKCDNFNLGKNEPLMNVVEIIEKELGLKTINDFKPMLILNILIICLFTNQNTQ